MECLHCNKTPMCIQVPGDLLTCTQHWQSAARVRCAWWWWHHHFWQLSPTSVEWGNVPKIKTDSRINNDRFFEPFLCVLNWCSISSIGGCQKIIITFTRHFSTPPVRVTGDTSGCYWASRLLHDDFVTCRHWLNVFSTGDGQVSWHQTSCHPHRHANISTLGIQLEITQRDVVASSWMR